MSVVTKCTPCDLDSSFDLGRWIGLAILHHNAFDRTLFYENVRSRWLQQSHLLLLLLACSTPLLFLVASPILSPMIQNKPLIPFTRNDSDGEEKPVVPVKTVDKNTARTTKRNVEPQAPVRTGGAGGNRRGPGGNEGAFRDRGAGSNRNQNRSTEEAPRDGPRGGAGARVRGGRGARHARERDDRHPSKFGGHGGSDKQAAQSWGANEGTAELKDEQAGEAIAKDEQKDAVAEDAAAEAAAAEEEAEKQVSYEEYLAQQAEKKAALDSGLKVREANEGSKLDKKWANAKPLENEEEEYFAPTGGKAQRQRERKVKQ
ncbi:hypothetical protein FOXYS1_10334, partial [Fusarium oxysporum]